jgi:hypothetical protein
VGTVEVRSTESNKNMSSSPHSTPSHSSDTGGKSVLIVGLEPSLIDFTDSNYAAFPGMTAAKVIAGLAADQANLKALGYEADLCLTDFGQTAEAVVSARLKQKRFDCIVIGAGVRTVASNFILFEKLINVVHEHAPAARLCFNTKPTDTADAIRRWI